MSKLTRPVDQALVAETVNNLQQAIAKEPDKAILREVLVTVQNFKQQ